MNKASYRIGIALVHWLDKLGFKSASKVTPAQFYRFLNEDYHKPNLKKNRVKRVSKIST